MGVYLGFEDYEDLIDIMDTMAEQLDTEFQQSLIDGKQEIKAGKGISEEELDKVLKKQMKYVK